MIVFWLLSFAAGYGLTAGVQAAGIAAIPAGPSSPLFMLAALLIVTLLYQIRMNIELPRPKGALFVFAPPTASILVELSGFFIACLLLLG